MRSHHAVLTVLFFFALPGVLQACKRTPDTPVANAREVVRAEVLADPDNCFKNNAAYCITDPAFIEAVIDDKVNRMHNGTMPDRRRGVERLTKQVAMSYRSAQLADEKSREQVLSNMRAYYENAPIEREGPVARTDVGYVPTGFVERRRGFVLSSDSPLLENNQPQTRFLAQQLLRLRQAHPDAQEYRVTARSFRASSLIITGASWNPSRDLVWITREQDIYRTISPLGPELAPLVNGQVSLATGLHSCNGEGAAHDPLCRR